MGDARDAAEKAEGHKDCTVEDPCYDCRVSLGQEG